MAATTEDLRQRVREREWYHTLELAPGVVTPGWFDTRQVADELLPGWLGGQRCLDVGTFDGFWAFELERRGADEVVAVDLVDPSAWDWPAGSSAETIDAIGRRKGGGEGFQIARDALGSSVERLEMSVYDLEEAHAGLFDFIYVGSLLLHLRDPVRALERLRAVCRGWILVVDTIDLELTLALPRKPVAQLDGIGRPWWWKPNAAGLARMVEAAGFRVEDRPRRIFMPPGEGQRVERFHPRMLTSRAGRDAAVLGWRGDPHAVLSATPR